MQVFKFYILNKVQIFWNLRFYCKETHVALYKDVFSQQIKCNPCGAALQ